LASILSTKVTPSNFSGSALWVVDIDVGGGGGVVVDVVVVNVIIIIVDVIIVVVSNFVIILVNDGIVVVVVVFVIVDNKWRVYESLKAARWQWEGIDY
jgi:hypothetical protein